FPRRRRRLPVRSKSKHQWTNNAAAGECVVTVASGSDGCGERYAVRNRPVSSSVDSEDCICFRADWMFTATKRMPFETRYSASVLLRFEPQLPRVDHA